MLLSSTSVTIWSAESCEPAVSLPSTVRVSRSMTNWYGTNEIVPHGSGSFVM